jgi:hypothetical protein
MSEERKIYEALSFLIDKQPRSSKFYLSSEDKEYHMLSDGDIVIILIYHRADKVYEISTMSFTGSWIDLTLNDLVSIDSTSHRDLMWRHLEYFRITPDQIYGLYSSEGFEYCPRYHEEEEE